jgi:LAO/AO transport system kinase
LRGSCSGNDVTTQLGERLLARDPRAVARALSVVVDNEPRAAELLAQVHPHTGRAWILGITGPPGAGKSTLVDRLITALRAEGRTVGVLAVDPTSPFSGGAILGDRIRMQAHASDSGVFIRSLATRGYLGGLSGATGDATVVLDAAGFDVVIIETVGVGQDEVAVASLADLTVVVLVPGAGDDIQMLKAGIMEIGDLFVVNKADRPDADRLIASLEAALALDAASADRPRPEIVRTVATTGIGVGELVAALDRRRIGAAGETMNAKRRRRADAQVRDALGRHVLAHIAAADLSAAARRVSDRLIDPRQAARELIAQSHLAAASAGEAASGALDHVGIVAADTSAILGFLSDALQLAAGPVEQIASERVQVRFVDSGAGRVELIEPSGSPSPIDKFLATRGPGLHHVAFRVDDLAAALSSLKARGVRVIDETPRPGAHGTSIAFVHPSSAGGVLVELVERRRVARADR